jgi:DNA-binding transcriptional ArsR family regulator
VLEELVLNADAGSDDLTVLVPASVRALASEVGLSKDTVAAALRRLANAGLVRRQDERESDSGRFGHSRYLVDLTSTGIGLAAPSQDSQPKVSDTVIASAERPEASTAVDTAARAGRRPRRASAAGDSQLSLLDPEPNPA